MCSSLFIKGSIMVDLDFLLIPTEIPKKEVPKEEPKEKPKKAKKKK